MMCLRFITPFLFYQVVVQATIRLDDNGGQTFASHVSRDYGTPLYRHVGYKAHLQMVPDNFALCQVPNAQYNLTTPPDNHPVALLVQSGLCSLEEKMQVALQAMQPAGWVHHLILDNEHQEDFEALMHTWNEAAEKDEFMLRRVVGTDDSSAGRRQQSLLYLGGLNATNDDKPDPILHVEFVSLHSARILLEAIIHQSKESRASGGLRLTIDANVGNGFLDGPDALWVAVLALASACCCSFFLVMNGYHEREPPMTDDNQHQQPQRPQRRRLTKVQVRKLLPIYVFDGERLQHIVQRSESQDEAEGGANHGLEPDAPVPSMMDLREWELCSICLDDYEAGDKLRVLPCEHAFHYRCIGKWLSERSATCPLCKYDVWPLEEEDEEDAHAAGSEAEQVETSTESWQSLLRQMLMPQQHAPATQSPPAAVTATTETAAASPPHLSETGSRSSWWRRMWPRQRSNAVGPTANDMLTEPLLASDEEEQAVVGTDTDASGPTEAAAADEIASDRSRTAEF